MLSIFKKKPVTDEEMTLLERVNKLTAKIHRLEAEMMDLIASQDIIRNKVLRKIQTKKPKEEEETDSYAGIPKI